jgi:excisionase family DNA binding protein
MPRRSNELLLTLPMAAASLGLSYGSAYALLLRGELEGRRVGKHWRVTRSSVEKLRADRVRASEPAPAA